MQTERDIAPVLETCAMRCADGPVEGTRWSVEKGENGFAFFLLILDNLRCLP